MLHERSIAYRTFEEKSKLVQDSFRVQYVSELFHLKSEYVLNLNSGFPDKIPYMDKINKDWQTDLYEKVAKKSPQIIPLFKYLYFAIILFLIFGANSYIKKGGVDQFFYTSGVYFGRTALTLLGFVVLPGILGRFAAFCVGVRKRVHTVHGFGFNDFQPKLKWLGIPMKYV